MDLVRRLLLLPRCEVLINFMYEEINRFISLDDHARNFDALFGKGCDWRSVANEVDPRVRNARLHSLYTDQLRGFACAKYVRSFEMRNSGNRVDYFMFYATGHIKGLSVMKDAMWKADPSGRFQFSDATDPNQLALFDVKPDLDYLCRSLAEHFRGQCISFADVEEFVLAETPFTGSHCKSALRSLELADLPSIAVESTTKRRTGTFANPSAKVTFLSS